MTRRQPARTAQIAALPAPDDLADLLADWPSHLRALQPPDVAVGRRE